MDNFLKRASLSFLIGYIVVFFSELVFWNVNPSEIVITWIFYSVVIFFCLCCVSYFKVRNVWAVFLIAALFGWITEGIVVQTIFFFFPLSLSFTSLSWHALISFMIGFYYIRRLLLQNKYRKTILVSCLLGLFWGFWWLGWAIKGMAEEGVKLVYDFGFFFMFAFITGAFFVLAHWLFGKFEDHDFKHNKVEFFIVSVLVLLQFFLVAVANVPQLIFVIPPLFLIVFLALWKNKRIESGKNFLTTLSGNVKPLNYLLLFVIPLVAVLVYGLSISGFESYADSDPENAGGLHFLFLVMPQTIIGSLFLIFALGKIFFQGRLYKNIKRKS